MLTSEKYAVEDPDVVRSLIRANPWTTLISQGRNAIVASHYAMLLDERTDELAVIGHLGLMDKRNHRFRGEEMLLIFQGPHGYVSPSWYGPEATRVPTWNFSVAHCYGVAEVLSDEENQQALTDLVAHFEKRVDQPLWLEQQSLDAMAGGTIGIRVPITRFICRVKMSNDLDEQSRESVVSELRGSGPYANPRLADEMDWMQAGFPAR